MEVVAEMFRSKSETISEYCGGNREIATPPWEVPPVEVATDISIDWSAKPDVLLPEILKQIFLFS